VRRIRDRDPDPAFVPHLPIPVGYQGSKLYEILAKIAEGQTPSKNFSMSQPRKILRVGIIGLGEVAQVSHILVLNNLSDYYQITYLCHASQDALQHCSRKVNGGLPKTTSIPEQLIASPEVDVVLLCNPNAFHSSHAILALQHDKYVLLEKPAALNYRDLDAIAVAESKSLAKVFVGYQRRYAEAFVDAVKEVRGMEKIKYARFRG
jgi:predicted dehydrogenase